MKAEKPQILCLATWRNRRVNGICVLSQLCLTLCDPIDCSPRGSSVHDIFQARILEWVPFPTPWDLPDPGWNPCLLHFLHWQADSLPLCLPPGKPKKDTVTNKAVHQRADNTTMCLLHSDI